MAESQLDHEPNRAAFIFRAAAEIFQRKGYHATAMGEMAEAVDLMEAGRGSAAATGNRTTVRAAGRPVRGEIG